MNHFKHCNQYYIVDMVVLGIITTPKLQSFIFSKIYYLDYKKKHGKVIKVRLNEGGIMNCNWTLGQDYLDVKCLSLTTTNGSLFLQH